jgi:hypothetical protein
MEEPMKNKKLQLGMLAAVLVFGLMFVGCSDTGGGGSGPKPPADKSIIITGITGKTGGVDIYIVSNFAITDFIVAIGTGTISGNSVTLPLMESPSTPWNGSGSYNLWLFFDNDPAGVSYVYTGGKTLTSLDIPATFTLAGQAAKIPKYNISSKTSSIALNQFVGIETRQ